MWHSPPLIVQRLFWLSFLFLDTFFETCIYIQITSEIDLLYISNRVIDVLLYQIKWVRWILILSNLALIITQSCLMLLALTIANRIGCVVLNDVLDERIFIEMDLVVEHAHFLKDNFIVLLHWLVLFHDCRAWARSKDHRSFFNTSCQTIMPTSTRLSSCTLFNWGFQFLY